MTFHFLRYAAVITGIGFGILSLTFTGWWTLSLPIYAFLFIPVLELIIKAEDKNLSETEEQQVGKAKRYDYLLYAILPLQYALLIYFFFQVGREGLSGWEITGMTFSMGIACAVFGINVAHELGHRPKKFEQWISKSLLLTSLYMHFFIEHNRGHHKYVATQRDPASSRYGEILYAFWFRSVINGYFSAWKLEKERLHKLGKSAFSINNEMIQFQFVQAGALAIVALFFSWQVMLYFVAAATIGFLMLETVNYIEHYGLQRKATGTGKYERVLPAHSWNSNHMIGRVMLFELSRHSDHHYKASRKYQVLRHIEGTPQMPTGYPGMMMLAFIPPAWFAVMHPVISKYEESASVTALA